MSQYWINGDFNYDGTVNSLDFNVLVFNYGNSTTVGAGPTLGAIVPEPQLAALLKALFPRILRRRR